MTFDPIVKLNEKDIAHLAEADAALETLKRHRRTVLPASSFTGMATWGFASYGQVRVHRTVHLAEGVRAEWNARRGIDAVVLLRSLIETVASFNFVLERGYSFLKKKDLRGFDDQVMKAMYGGRQKSEQFPEMPEATNERVRVVSCLRDIGRFLNGAA